MLLTYLLIGFALSFLYAIAFQPAVRAWAQANIEEAKETVRQARRKKEKATDSSWIYALLAGLLGFFALPGNVVMFFFLAGYGLIAKTDAVNDYMEKRYKVSG